MCDLCCVDSIYVQYVHSVHVSAHSRCFVNSMMCTYLLHSISLLVQSAASSVPPTVTSFLPCPPSPTKHQSLKERAHELKQRLEEKDRKLKEFELHRHQEHKDKFK